MANSDHLERLRQGDTQDWNSWREENPTIAPDLSGAALREASLIGMDLSRSNMLGAKLAWGRLVSVDFSEAHLLGADFRWADLRGVRFAGANLEGVRFDGVVIVRSAFDECRMHTAVFNETTFSNVDLHGAVGLEFCDHLAESYIDHQTLAKFAILPVGFLRGCGLPEALIRYLPSILNEAVSFYSCFLSYSHADQSFARRLHDTLQGRDIRCWLDEHQIITW